MADNDKLVTQDHLRILAERVDEKFIDEAELKKAQESGEFDGADGVSITKIEQTTTSTDDGGTNVITVTLSDGTKATFKVKNGSTGGTGATGARGSLIYWGTAITGTSTTPTVFSSSGISSALVNDVYINTSTWNVYQCTTAGAASAAKWTYIGNIKGAPGADATVTVDSALSGTSTNPVQNKVVKSALDGKLGKTTYEYNAELALGSTGKVCIGKFPMYDSNISVEIKSTTNTPYNGTLVIATQNINTSGGGTYTAKVYGDADNSLTDRIKIEYLSGSNVFSVYIDLPGWSKNLLHIQCVALKGTPTDIATTVTEIPSTATIVPTNALKTQLDTKANKATAVSFTLASASWASGSGVDEYPYVYKLTVPGVTTDSVADAVFDDASAAAAGEAGVSTSTETEANTVIFKSRTVPTVALNGTLYYH